MPKVPFACADCYRILDEDQCPHHPGASVTIDWQGYVVILDAARSEIARQLNIDTPGTYALKVNVR